MNLLKITLSVAAVFLISISAPTFRTPAAAAENEPLDVHLTIETKESDINDIPDDRIIYLGITVENAPPFKGMTMYLEKDPRLKFGEFKPFKPAEGAKNIGSINVISREDAPNILGCGVPAKGTKMIDHSGVLIMTELILPEDVRAGDFFYLKFSPYLGSSYMVIDLSIFPEDRYGLDSFTELNNGGIRITEKTPSKPPASTASSTTSSKPASTASSSTTTASSTTSSKPVSTTSSSTTTASSTTSSKPASTASSSTKASSATSSTPASTVSPSTATASSATSSTPASTVSPSTATASSATSSTPASTTSSSTTTASSTTSSTPASTASTSTSAVSSVSSTSSSVPETTEDTNKEKPESKNKFWITAVPITLGAGASSLLVVFLVRKKRKE